MNPNTTEINLTPGSTWVLDLENQDIEEICIGLSWGVIKHKSFFGLVSKPQTVDLDACFSMFDNQKKHLDTVYYGNLISFDGALRHSGDDRNGEAANQELSENELVECDLKRLSPEVHSIFIYVNSYSGKDFSEIPFVRLRIYQGLKPSARKLMAVFHSEANPKHRLKTCMVVLEIRKVGNAWHFKAIGESNSTKKLKETLEILELEYV
jgi:tellurium resistance protein TerZ